jgi:hypothetical protein
VIGPRLIFTQHALDMLVERRIERTWVELTIRTPDAAEPDPTRPDVTRAFRRIPERDGRILRVAYVSNGDIVRILTVFFDRARRR